MHYSCDWLFILCFKINADNLSEPECHSSKSSLGKVHWDQVHSHSQDWRLTWMYCSEFLGSGQRSVLKSSWSSLKNCCKSVRANKSSPVNQENITLFSNIVIKISCRWQNIRITWDNYEFCFCGQEELGWILTQCQRKWDFEMY